MVINESNEGKLKGQFGDWYELIKPFLLTDAFDKIIGHLKATVNAGKQVIPKSNELFKSFEKCSRHKVKTIILLQCPYATKRQDVVIADGIPMSCGNIAPYMQPILYQWYQALEKTYGFDVDNDQRPDISYLLEEEGVLLLNSALSVEYQKVDSHAQLWEPFTKFILEEVVGQYMPGIPIVLCGTAAQKYEKYILPMKNPIKKIEHPASASYQNRDWKYDDIFKWINNIIEQNNGKEYTIRWIRKKHEVADKDNVALQEWLKPMKNENDEVGDLPWQKKIQ